MILRSQWDGLGSPSQALEIVQWDQGSPQCTSGGAANWSTGANEMGIPSAARESIAVSSGSDLGNDTLPDRGSAAESSSPEPSSPSDAAIDILSSAGAPNEMLGPALSEDPASSSGNTRWCDVLEEWEAHVDTLDRETLTVILKSPWPWAKVALRKPEGLQWGMARGIRPHLTRRYLERNIAMIMFPQWEHDSSTSPASACW